MVSKERVESVLNRVRPFLTGRRRRYRAAGGERQFRRRPADRDVRRLPERAYDADLGVEAAIRKDIPEFEMLRLV